MESGSNRGQGQSPHSQRSGGGEPPRTSRKAAKEILIVDNDERIVELVSWFLVKRGYSVRKASNFGTARHLLQEKGVDLLLSDLDLGSENALDILPAMQAEGVLPPTLVFSGYLDAPSRERLMALEPVVGTLSKPVEFQVLESCVANYFSGKPIEAAADDWIPRPNAGAPGATVSPASNHENAGDEWVEILPPQA